MYYPISNFLKNFFAKKRILIENTPLAGLTKANDLLNGLIIKEKVPGMAVTVLKEGKPVLEKGYGFINLKNRIPVNTQKSIFRIASVSKPIAATALAHMVKDGLINLDKSFYDYVPYYPKKKWDFTIRQLASHTSGVRGYRGKEYGLNKPFSIKEGISIFKDDELLFEPGTNYLYNSFNWVLISLAMQEVSGIPFEEYVKDKVFRPLEMNHTFSEPTFFEDMVTFYSKNRSGFKEAITVDNHYKLAGGGFVSTTQDIAKLGQAYLENGIMSSEVLSQFLTSEMINQEKTYYGLGWQVSKDARGRSFYGHVGNGVGGYANFYVYPKQQMVFVFLINCTNPNIQDELDEVIDILITNHNADVVV